MMLPDAARPPRQSFFEEPSTVGCDAVMACTAVIDDSYVSWFTPMTTVWESSLAGAEKTTFLAPAFKCGCTFSVVRNTPVDSHTYSAPCSLNGISAGSRVWDKATFLP